MRHQRQPTKTSCGPTVVAILLGLRAEMIIRRLWKVRTAARRKLQTERTNVGELRRLLGHAGLTLGKRTRNVPRVAIVRVDHAVGRGWHWSLKSDRWIFDPAYARSSRAASYLKMFSGRISFYEITDGDTGRPE